ncbi:MAG: LolA-related protein [Gammaproteobacteria bacterium]
MSSRLSASYLLLMGLGLVTIGQTADEAGFTLARLMRELAAVKIVNASFEEDKQLAALQQPLKLTGVLHYRAPDYLQKKTLTPQPENIEVVGGRLIIERPDKGREELALGDYPPLHAFVESFRSTLAGDLASLERYYVVSLAGDARNWLLRLEPRDQEMQRFVRSILIRGHAAGVLGVEIVEAGGDRSSLSIAPIND